ncbi:MAG: type II secretion system GspH family protein [Pirellulaceae bacterium]|nr:type II secretion system GspH family protein [Pirellulaceae bacterium]
MFKVKQTTRHGFSLIELVLVVMVLAILAGFVIPLIGNFTAGGEKSEKQIITETSMLAIRNAILGTPTSPGAWSDLGQQPALFPTDPFWLTLEYEQLGPLAPHIYAKGPFDPVTKIGWRGPYLKGGFRDSEGSNAFRDGWNKSLAIFVPETNGNSEMDSNDVTYARLVSRGENETLETAEENTTKYDPGGTNPSTSLTLEDCGDDIVLFFFVGDNRQ